MRKVKMNSSTNDFQLQALEDYLRGVAIDVFEEFENRSIAQVISHEVPGYDPDWCAVEQKPRHTFLREKAIDAMVEEAKQVLLDDMP